MARLPVLLVFLLGSPPPPAPPDALLGAIGAHRIAPGESLIELAPQYDLGFNEIADANPGLDPYVPAVGETAVLPTAWILPRAAAPGTVVVNLSEMRLYLVPAAPEPPVTFPIGVSVEPGATPLGTFTVIEKSVHPTWYPTRAMRAEDPTLPESVPPGPDNPLGAHALRLSPRTILIHGTNRPFGVGRRVSHGCIRLYPEDIDRLFRLVEIGTPVAIVRERVKVAARDGRIYLEVHGDEAGGPDLGAEAVQLLGARGVLGQVDGGKLVDAVRARRGIPVRVDGGAD